MLRHNLEVEREAAARQYGFRQLGRPTGRIEEHVRALSRILGGHYFVEVIFVPVYRPLEGQRGTVLEVVGSPANLETAEYVHDFLLRSGESLWAEHKRALGVLGNRDRRSFLSGLMSGFLEKLDRQAARNREQGLVWVRDADLRAYYHRRYPRIRTIRRTGPGRSEAFDHGREAGRGLVIHPGMRSGGPAAGRLLPGRTTRS
jgi:hypothetical protein